MQVFNYPGIRREKCTVKPEITISNNGAVFIYDLTSSTGNVSKTMMEEDKRVFEALSDPDVSDISVKVLAYAGDSNLRPNCTVNEIPVIWNSNVNVTNGAYEGYIILQMNNGEIKAVHEDGPEHIVNVLTEVKPNISSVTINGYPGNQTELKANDTRTITVTADIPFTSVEIFNESAGKTKVVNVSSTTSTSFTVTIPDRGDVPTESYFKVRVAKSTGTYSDYFISNSNENTDGLTSVILNNKYPYIEFIDQSDIIYPDGQLAIKNDESVTVKITANSFDTIFYTSPNGELDIPDPAVYIADKASVSRVGGTYNVYSSNYRITANKASNDATTIMNGVVKIANVAPVITISKASHFRKGGTDGSAVQSYKFTLDSNQYLLDNLTVTVDSHTGVSGEFNGSFSKYYSTKRYKGTIAVTDDCVNSTYQLTNLNGIINLAGIPTTIIASGEDYVISGFVSRELILPAFENEVTLHTAISNINNLFMRWTAKSLPNFTTVNDNVTPQQDSWTVTVVGSNPTVIRILDTAATDAQSKDTYITIEEF